MTDNLFDRCLTARGFLSARNRHNFIYFNRLHRNYLFDGCLIQGEGLRQGQTVAEGFPEPIIRELGLRARFVFPLAKQIQVKQATGPRVQSGAQSTSILMALSDVPLSALEIATVLGLETKIGAFKRIVKELLEQGMIEYTIPEKPINRLQKYRLTDTGKKMVRELLKGGNGE